ETRAPRPPHRAAARRANGVAGDLHRDPRRLPRPGGLAARRKVVTVQGVFTAEEMRRLDRRAITELGIPSATLMENAGRGAAVVIDALLGTGSRGAPEGNIARAITLINRSARPVVALDIPSGISADDGGHQAAAVQAVLTLTFAGLKRGLITGPGAALAGRVRVIPIGVPDVEVARGVTTF